MFDGFSDRRDMEADRRARFGAPSLAVIRQDVRRELGHGCPLDRKLGECQRLEKRVTPPNPINTERKDLVDMLGEAAEDAYEAGMTDAADFIDMRREMHGGTHPDDGRSAPGDPGDFGGGL